MFVFSPILKKAIVQDVLIITAVLLKAGKNSFAMFQKRFLKIPICLLSM